MGNKTEFLTVEDQDKVKIWTEHWDEVLKESVIVQIHIWKWHPFARLNSDRMERLGVHFESEEAKKAFHSVMRSGSIDLIPREVQNRVTCAETGARKILKDLTIEVMWGNLLPASAYEIWKKKHDKYVKDFWDAVEYICTNLRNGDCLLEQMKAEYRPIFADTWTRLSKMNGSVGVHVPESQEEFIQEAIKDLLDSVPVDEAVRDKYRFETAFLDAPMSDEIAESEARAAKIRLESLQSNEALSNAHRKIIAEMRKKVAEQSESRRQQVEQSLAMAENAFYQGLLDIVKNVNSSINEKGKIGGRIGLQLRHLAERVRTLNVFDDDTLSAQIDSLTNSLDLHQALKSKNKDFALEEIQTGLFSTEIYIKKQLDLLPSKRGIRMIDSGEFDMEDSDSTRRFVSKDEAEFSIDEESLSLRRV